MSAFFITSSGTGIGKTFVTAALSHQLMEAGESVCAYKPVISGFDYASAHESDTALLAQSQGLDWTVEVVEALSPWRYAAPLSPHMAAAQEGDEVPVDALLGWCREQMLANPGITLFEGVGGVMVPLTLDFTVLDWINALRIPTIMVVGSYLGSLSHTLTACRVMELSGVELQAICVSESEDNSVGLDETVDTLTHMLPVPVVALPRADHYRDAPNLLPLLESAHARLHA